jgi:hypothetical protein
MKDLRQPGSQHDAVRGAIEAGNGFAQLEELLEALRLAHHFNWNPLARSMLKAIQEGVTEAQAATEEGISETERDARILDGQNTSIEELEAAADAVRGDDEQIIRDEALVPIRQARSDLMTSYADSSCR